MSRFWKHLEVQHGLAAVRQRWRTGFGPEYESALGFLQDTDARAREYPCPHGCGCRHRIVRHDDGRIVASCQCDPWNCDTFSLTDEDTRILALNLPKLGRAIARALGCEASDVALDVTGARQVATFSPSSLPVVLVIRHGPQDFLSTVTSLVARLREPFVLLAPTGRFVDARSKTLLAGVQAGFFDLDSNLSLLPSGLLRSRRSAGELFSGLLLDGGEEFSEDDLRKLYGRILAACGNEAPGLRAPLKAVFDLYCRDGFSADQIALKLGCSKATVITRLKTLKQKTGVNADQLRGHYPTFARIEQSIRDPRARRIRIRNALESEDPDDASPGE